MEGNVKVLRVNTLDIHLVGMIRRGIGVLLLPFTFIKTGKKYIDNQIDLIFVYSPPLTLSIAGRKLSKYFSAKCVLNVQDLFPQNAVDLGLMKNRVIIYVFKLIEKYAYRSSDYITVHSEGNMRIIRDNMNVSPDKIGIFHNWVDTNQVVQETYRDIDFRKQYSLSDNFVVIFGGVMGPAQGLDVVLSAAEYLGGEKVTFLLIGDGTEKAKLQKLALERNLDNVVFQPFLDVHEYEALLKCVDAGLVTLSKGMKTPVVPGKLVSFMANKIPVIASVNEESDARKIIMDSKCGLVGDAGDGMKLADNILKLLNSPELSKQMGESGRDYVGEYMSKNGIIKKYIDLFHNLTSQEKPFL